MKSNAGLGGGIVHEANERTEVVRFLHGERFRRLRLCRYSQVTSMFLK